MWRLKATLILCVFAAAAQLGHAQGGRRTWTDYGGGPDNARYFTLDQINKSNLDQLAMAWTYPTSDNISYVFNPIVVDNVMYVLARNNSLVALDATTGKEIWIHEGLQGIAPRGINYWESKDRTDRRLLFQMNSYLQAIDARTGKSITTFGKDGVVNLRDGLGRDPATIVKTQSSTPGKVFENLIILGSAAGENYMAPPGDLRAFDVVSGALVWQFHTVPHPGEFGYETWPKDAWKYIGGVNTWGEITVDPVRGIAYFPLGSPTYDFYGADRHGANLFGTSLLALNARTGKRLWHFQMVHHDLWDYDNTAAPQLTTVRSNGKTIDVVAQAGKTGFLYVFDRVTGEPLWPIEERPVPPSEIPGERAWPTQPFPTAPPPFAPQTSDCGRHQSVHPHRRRARDVEDAHRRCAQSGAVYATFLAGHGFDARRSGWSQLGLHRQRSVEGDRVCVEHQRALDLQVEHRSAGSGRRRKSRRTRGRGAGAHALYAEVPDVPWRRPAEAAETIRRWSTLRRGWGRSRFEKSSRVVVRACRPTTIWANPKSRRCSRFSGIQTQRVRAGEAAVRARLSLRAVVLSSRRAAQPPGGSFPPGRAGGMVGPDYPTGIDVPEVRMYTGYGMNGTIVKPPYSTLTAYDLNAGTIKWQVPAGGDDARAVAQGAKDTGFISQRTGIITTSAGLLFHAGGDGKLRVYDSETGRILRTVEQPAGSRGIPAMYEVNGRQFFVVNATSTVAAASGQGSASQTTR